MSDAPERDKQSADPREARRLLRSAEAGFPVDAPFLVRQAELRTARRDGSHFLAIQLADAAGSLDARRFDADPDQLAELQPGSVVRVSGEMARYRDRPQLVIRSIAPDPDTQPDAPQLSPPPDTDIPAQWDRLREQLAQIRPGTPWAQIRDAYLADKPFLARFRSAPATQSGPRAWPGGLLDQAVATLDLADGILSRLGPEVEPDLVRLGIWLRDSGYAFALEQVAPRLVEWTTPGRLIGPIALGISYLDRKLQQIDGLPSRPGWLLRHVILATTHPDAADRDARDRRPMIREAAIVASLHDLDRQLRAWSEVDESTIDSTGVTFSDSLRHTIYAAPIARSSPIPPPAHTAPPPPRPPADAESPREDPPAPPADEPKQPEVPGTPDATPDDADSEKAEPAGEGPALEKDSADPPDADTAPEADESTDSADSDSASPDDSAASKKAATKKKRGGRRKKSKKSR